MAPTDDLEIIRRDGYIEARFKGEFRPAAAMKVVDVMVTACRDAGCSRVLLDCQHMIGTPSVVDQFTMAEYGAEVIHRHIEVAMVVPNEGQLPDEFFENAAVSRGVRVRVFTDTGEAVAWLSGRG